MYPYDDYASFAGYYRVNAQTNERLASSAIRHYEKWTQNDIHDYPNRALGCAYVSYEEARVQWVHALIWALRHLLP